MAWKKTAKENQMPNTTPLVTNACSRMNQAYGAMRWLEVVEVAVGIDVSTPLHHRIAAAHAERLPGDVASTIRGEKGHGLSDVFRDAKLAERIQPDDAG